MYLWDSCPITVRVVFSSGSHHARSSSPISERHVQFASETMYCRFNFKFNRQKRFVTENIRRINPMIRKLFSFLFFFPGFLPSVPSRNIVLYQKVKSTVIDKTNPGGKKISPDVLMDQETPKARRHKKWVLIAGGVFFNGVVGYIFVSILCKLQRWSSKWDLMSM